VDTNALVAEGSKLVSLLDNSKLKPRAAMWVYNSETDTWKLWIVPALAVSDKREFYLELSNVISAHRKEIPSLDISSIEFKEGNHPAVKGLGAAFSVNGLSSVHLSNTSFNGFSLPNGIILRMAV
jgi:hypothetical protein